MTKNRESGTIREAVGVFIDGEGLHMAVDELLSSGFSISDLGLLAGEYTVRQRLGRFYKVVNESADTAEGPSTAFVADESMGDTVHALLGSLFFVGTTAAAGAIVASAAVLGGALLVAASGAAALGAIGGALSLIIHQSDAEHLEEQIDEGHLLLFVRARNSVEEASAIGILSRRGALEARVYEAPATPLRAIAVV